MPIYEYECEGCGRRHEALVRHADDEVRCPACGGVKQRRLLSVFAAGSGKGAASACDGCGASDACAGFAPAAGGCCGPGGCRH